VISIRVLAETPHVETVAGWLHTEWWVHEGWSLDATIGFLRAAVGPAAPVSFVAEVDARPAGHAMLDVDDLKARPDLTPWIVSVLVAPEFRGRGVGRALAYHVVAAARARGYTTLWAHTSTALDYWKRFGFVEVGAERWAGGPTTLLRLDL
jgi:predicted N-acetyltransferase YhbS